MPFVPMSRPGWTITADSEYSAEFIAAKAIDGVIDTFWHSGATYPHYVIVDMGAAQTFDAFRFTPRSDERTDPMQVKLYVSDDGSTWGTPIATDTWASSAAFKYFEFASVTKRWLKFEGVTGAGGTLYMACAEIHIGYMREFFPVARTGWIITADSELSVPGYAAVNAIDDVLITFWHSTAGYPHYLTVDMGSAKTIDALRFTPRSDGVRTDPKQVEIYVSDDGVSWGSAIGSDSWLSSSSDQYLFFASVNKRWFQFRAITGANNAHLACSEIHAGSVTPLISMQPIVTIA